MFSSSSRGGHGGDGVGRRPVWWHRGWWPRRHRPTAVLGATTQRAVRQQQHRRLEGAGGGGHVRGAGRQDGHRDRAGSTTRVRWPTAGPTAGDPTAPGSWATTVPPTRRCRWRWTPTGCCTARQSLRSAPARHTCAVADGQGLLLGIQLLRAVGQQQHHSSTVPVAVDTTGVLAGKTVTAIAPGQSTRVRWPTAGPTAGATTAPGSSATTAPPARLCRWRWKPLRAAGRQDGHSDHRRWTTIRVRWPTAGLLLGTQQYGQLGDDSTTDSMVPVAVDTTGPLAGRTVTAIAAGVLSRVCGGRGQGVLLGPQQLRATRQQQHHQLERAGGGGHRRGAGRQDASLRSPPATHTCAVADGRAYCWGYNGDGQSGNNSHTDSSVPVAVVTTGALAGRTVTAISAGGLPHGGIACRQRFRSRRPR